MSLGAIPTLTFMPLAQIENARKNEIRHNEIRRCQTQQRDVRPPRLWPSPAPHSRSQAWPIARAAALVEAASAGASRQRSSSASAHQVAWRSRKDSNL